MALYGCLRQHRRSPPIIAWLRGRWMVKLDLKAAFKRVRLPEGARGSLGFPLGGSRWACTALPFGWAWSPEVFREALNPVVAALH